MLTISDLSESTNELLSSAQLAKAGPANRTFAQSLGWAGHLFADEDYSLALLESKPWYSFTDYADENRGYDRFSQSVAKFQKENDLSADGIMGPGTFRAYLNYVIESVSVDMELYNKLKNKLDAYGKGSNTDAGADTDTTIQPTDTQKEKKAEQIIITNYLPLLGLGLIAAGLWIHFRK